MDPYMKDAISQVASAAWTVFGTLVALALGGAGGHTGEDDDDDNDRDDHR